MSIAMSLDSGPCGSQHPAYLTRNFRPEPTAAFSSEPVVPTEELESTTGIPRDPFLVPVGALLELTRVRKPDAIKVGRAH
eukprot:CAMPEP_0206123222 /NCGR_PEP_ID=MMETSP1472-20131121/2683_1 /ASSEMBLY_ACC=CAM_ASM_001108 /TAXON_ID=41880 /ORGANISM="Pycnococcus provasolii, Strain RCC251" /LENGTH=79 /DNA_ID=CAMNT_0053513779 /DNA_START=367 /DNA_END=603 /DNA_ORIENTATION=+